MIDQRHYDPTDCYWQSDDGRVFSSKKASLVSSNDADLAAYQEAFWVRPWPRDASGAQTPASLQAVLDAAGVPIYADLLTYANRKQWSSATGGYTVTIAGQALTFATDQTSQALITGKALRFQQANPPASVDWQFATGFETVQAADFIATAIEIADFVQATFDAVKAVLEGIAAGTIKTVADVDAAGWPVNEAAS